MAGQPREPAGPVPAGRVRRVLPLATLAGRTAGESMVAALQQRVGRQEGASAAARRRAADRYAELLGRSRGVLMKAGQIVSFMSLSTPPDPGEPTPYREALQQLQSEAPPMAPQDAAAVVEAELGAPPGELYAEFEPLPFAAASIGQVHRARLRDGRAVAVKVQYPGVEEAIRADLANVDLLATFLRVAGVITPGMPKVDTRALVAEIAARIGEEIDYGAEAAAQSGFAAAYRGHPFVRVPEVIGELSTRRVLTMEFADGMTWAEAAGHGQELRDAWGEVIYRFVWGGLRRFRMAYADPHPGNYLFHTDGSVTFLDFGCVKNYPEDKLGHLVEMIRAGVAGDAERTWRASAALGSILPGRAPDPEELLGWMSEQWRPMTAEQPFAYTPEHAASVARRLFSPFGPHGAVVKRMNMPPDVLFFVRMDAGVTAILGALGSTGHWAAIRAELDGERPPATPLGRRDAEFWAAAEAAGDPVVGDAVVEDTVAEDVS
ncbi:ABC1 kinase family protein [Actinomadura roseirufa]|uniref:ABC1 kinase family protein n=1 Tax=Actinomadura roseirufa TaxID=2094049 RepID=UPI00104129B8|nr:AarF/ABC1/UbiB kinase family protein [Actinomadura roseirufa]